MTRAFVGGWNWGDVDTSVICAPVMTTVASGVTEDLPGLITVTWVITMGVVAGLGWAAVSELNGAQKSASRLTPENATIRMTQESTTEIGDKSGLIKDRMVDGPLPSAKCQR